jgi:hypothetical protein
MLSAARLGERETSRQRTVRELRRQHHGRRHHRRDARYRETGADDRQVFYSGQIGIERPFLALGKTTLYADYYAYDGGVSTPLLVGPNDALNPTSAGFWTVWNSNVEILGGGIAQGIDSAAMILYLTYKHVSGDLALRQLEGGVATGSISGAPIDDLDLLLTGAVIRF